MRDIVVITLQDQAPELAAVAILRCQPGPNYLYALERLRIGNRRGRSLRIGFDTFRNDHPR